jgi:hypothetical protein
MTWRMPLNMLSVLPPALPESVIEQLSFIIPTSGDCRTYNYSNWQSFGVSACYHIRAGVFKSNALRFKYVFGAFAFLSSVGMICRRVTIAQLWKLKPEIRTVPVRDNNPGDLQPHKLHFDKPDAWEFYDDMIPSLIRRGEVSHPGMLQ